MSEPATLFLILWVLLVMTWSVGVFAAVLIIKKFRQHSDTIRNLRQAHDIQEIYINGILDRMTQPKPTLIDTDHFAVKVRG